MSSVAQRLLTAEEFWQLPENDKRRELVRGEVIETMPPGATPGKIAIMLGRLLSIWADRFPGSYVGAEASYILARDPDLLRAPDVSYVRADRITPGGVPEAFWTIPPDLAVEIVSPSETADDVRSKVRDFLAAGTPILWTVYPRPREVEVHTPDGLARTYSGDDVIEHADVLPGFSCKVTELFE
jgi:Uma2 family endonuclease